ncbi:hypothetical protein CMUS01_06303 [Colletotrichum musicola]|uniref:Uncharacterized protein n=1 Tax=Colletotrichum musicola TaxID=2175873 RepID=A0A8H6NIP7_9PEZI|nr:hypothetical protein CMUS01_06303 [Colletotrichum musicola]
MSSFCPWTGDAIEKRPASASSFNMHSDPRTTSFMFELRLDIEAQCDESIQFPFKTQDPQILTRQRRRLAVQLCIILLVRRAGSVSQLHSAAFLPSVQVSTSRPVYIHVYIRVYFYV